MSVEKIRRQMQELRDQLRPPAQPVFGSGIVKDSELRLITDLGVTYPRDIGETQAEFQRRVCLEVNGKPLIVFGQPTDQSPPFVTYA